MTRTGARTAAAGVLARVLAASAERPGGRPRIALATRSPHKARELRDLLQVASIDFVSLDDLRIPAELEPDEDGTTFEANARLKARFYADASGIPTLADDSGIEVEALNGGPGVRTRRYAGDDATDTMNNEKLLRALEGLPPERRGARYVCVLALAAPAASPASAPGSRRRVAIVAQTRGTCRGRIATASSGGNGFGYDPIFEPAGEPPGGRTLGTWSADEKNRISHRAKAARRMARHLAAVEP